MMRLIGVLCATLSWHATAVEVATVKQTKAFFQNFHAYNETATPLSTAAFKEAFDLYNEAKGDSVWPFMLKVRGDTLTSSERTDSLLKSLFKGTIPAHHVLDKTHLLLYLQFDQLPTSSTLDDLIIVKQLLPGKPLTALPIGTRIGFDIFQQIASESVPKGAAIRLLVTLRDFSTYGAFRKQTVRELESKTSLVSMQTFEKFAEDSSDADALYVAAFKKVVPSDRFGKVIFDPDLGKAESTKSSKRVAVDVLVKDKNYKAALLYLTFYFARNLEHVLYVSGRTVEYPLAAHAAGFTQRGAYREGICDPMYHHDLLGQDQVIGLVDTGIDLTSSYLYAGSSGGPFCELNRVYSYCGGAEAIKEGKATEGADKIKYNKGARVVVRYDALADTEEGAAGGHGTFLAGVIAGAPSLSKAYNQCADEKHIEAKGMGRAKIAFYDVGFKNELALRTPAHDYQQTFRPAYAIGARLFTVAWGSGEFGDTSLNGEPTPKGEGLYTAAASDIDAFMHENKDALVVVAAGNSGPGSVTSPAISKNALTVGSLSASGTGASAFSAGGTQPDGRMKPDVIAIGDSVLSASSRATKGATDKKKRSHCDVVQKSGTSISAALVSAAAAQVRQYFEDGYYPSGQKNEKDEFARKDLWGSTVKAVLVAGAAPLLDFRKGGRLGTSEGYGSVILSNVLPFADDNQIDLDLTQASISAGEPYVKVVQIDSSDKPLVVTVAWTGPGAVLGTRSPMVNQLELTVKEEANQRDWSTEDDMEQIGNVKRFYVAEPNPGRYRITIKPSFVRDKQDFSLVVTGLFAEDDRASPLCCAGSSYPGLGSCVPLDTVICIIFVTIILVLLIAGTVVLSCRNSLAEKAASQHEQTAFSHLEQKHDDLHPL